MSDDCKWNESKHDGKPCPIHEGFASDLTDKEKEEIKAAGGLDADKYVSKDDEERKRVNGTERILKNRMDDINDHPERFFTKKQMKNIHNNAAMLGMGESRFIRLLAKKIVLGKRKDYDNAIEEVFKESY